MGRPRNKRLPGLRGNKVNLGQRRAKRKKSYKPQALIEQAAQLHIQGKSNREIGRQLGVDDETVPNMLAESEVLREYRRRLRARVPRALLNVDYLLDQENPYLTCEELGRTTRWVLDATQVSVAKTESKVETQTDALETASIEELDAFIRRCEECLNPKKYA